MDENAKLIGMTQVQLEELLTKILTDIKDAKTTGGDVDLSAYLKKEDVEMLTSEDITTIYDKVKAAVNA